MAHGPKTHWAGSRRLILVTLVVALVVGVPTAQFGQRVGRDLGGEPGGLLGMALPMLVVGLIAGSLIYYLAVRRHPGPGQQSQPTTPADPAAEE